jgi:hypothetical protein
MNWNTRYLVNNELLRMLFNEKSISNRYILFFAARRATRLHTLTIYSDVLTARGALLLLPPITPTKVTVSIFTIQKFPT